MIDLVNLNEGYIIGWRISISQQARCGDRGNTDRSTHSGQTSKIENMNKLRRYKFK